MAIVSQDDIQKFVYAAGIISHYVGDASQSLHVLDFITGILKIKEKALYIAYETGMIDQSAAEIITGIND